MRERSAQTKKLLDMVVRRRRIEMQEEAVSIITFILLSYEPRSEKTGLRGFRPGPTQTVLYSHRRCLEA